MHCTGGGSCVLGKYWIRATVCLHRVLYGNKLCINPQGLSEIGCHTGNSLARGEEYTKILYNISLDDHGFELNIV